MTFSGFGDTVILSIRRSITAAQETQQSPLLIGRFRHLSVLTCRGTLGMRDESECLVVNTVRNLTGVTLNHLNF